MDIVEILKNLSSLDGPSGYEFRVIDYIKQIANKLNKVKVEEDAQGNLIVNKEGKGKKIAVFAHVDEIGFVLTKKEEGTFFRFSTFGGIDPKVVISQRLRFYTRNGEIAYGVVGMLEPHLQTPETRKQIPTLDSLFIDMMDDADKVNIGDIGTFSSEPLILNEKYLSGKALDNRASCAVLLYTLELLDEFISKSESYFIFNVREEDGAPGVKGPAYRIKPDLAIVLDVTHGDVARPGYPKIETGKGPVFDIGPVISQEHLERLKTCAEKISVNYQIEPSGAISYTDTDMVLITKGGIPTILVSIPLRYMHTPYEVVNIKDLEETARLLAYFIARGGE